MIGHECQIKDEERETGRFPSRAGREQLSRHCGCTAFAIESAAAKLHGVTVTYIDIISGMIFQWLRLWADPLRSVRHG